MRITLLNPPHSSIGSRIPDEHLPPLGLLSIGGPLIDAGHHVTLVDADLENSSDDEIVRRVCALTPDVIMLGHSGSTSAHPVVARLTRLLRAELPRVRIVYGGVFPTYHHREVLAEEPQIDVVVRGEGEETVLQLVAALEAGQGLGGVNGLAYRELGQITATPAASTIADLDAYRIGWELIDHRRYTYWGDKRAVVIQFSRGCPHPCNYCGQRGFWTRWRHRDPKKFAAELAGTPGVGVILSHHDARGMPRESTGWRATSGTTSPPTIAIGPKPAAPRRRWSPTCCTRTRGCSRRWGSSSSAGANASPHTCRPTDGSSRATGRWRQLRSASAG